MNDSLAIHRFTVTGKWTKTKGLRRDKVAIDRKKKQAHAIDRSSVFIANKRMPIVKTLQELADLGVPEPHWDEQDKAIATEDNSVLPLYPVLTPPPIELTERTVDLLMAVEENKAPLDAESDDGATDKLLTTYRVFALGFLFVVFAGIILAILIYMSQHASVVLP